MRSLKPVLALLLATGGMSFADAVYVGSFQVDAGPSWAMVPLAYNGVEAAALLFGGMPAEYRISVNASLNPATITDTAWYTTWGGNCGGSFPCGDVYADDIAHSPFYLLDGDISAYARDWAEGPQYTNYVWRVTSGIAVPEPVKVTLLAAGVAILRRRKNA